MKRILLAFLLIGGLIGVSAPAGAVHDTSLPQHCEGHAQAEEDGLKVSVGDEDGDISQEEADGFVPEAGVVVCVKAGPSAINVTGDGESSLFELMAAVEFVNHGGQTPGVSYYIIISVPDNGNGEEAECPEGTVAVPDSDPLVCIKTEIVEVEKEVIVEVEKEVIVEVEKEVIVEVEKEVIRTVPGPIQVVTETVEVEVPVTTTTTTTAPPQPTSGELPKTGVNWGILALVGAVLGGSGLIFQIFGRKHPVGGNI